FGTRFPYTTLFRSMRMFFYRTFPVSEEIYSLTRSKVRCPSFQHCFCRTFRFVLLSRFQCRLIIAQAPSAFGTFFRTVHESESTVFSFYDIRFTTALFHFVQRP